MSLPPSSRSESARRSAQPKSGLLPDFANSLTRTQPHPSLPIASGCFGVTELQPPCAGTMVTQQRKGPQSRALSQKENED